MRHRYTIDELQHTQHPNYRNDLKMLQAVVSERQSDCTNIYAPLYRRLQKLYNSLDKAIKEGRTEL